MEKMLQKLARQLDSLDEASLMSLWSKYATLTSKFEPTAKWEEAALIFSLIQAKRWKNQLFNHIWSQARKPPTAKPEPIVEIDCEERRPEAPLRETAAKETQKCRILRFDGESD